jgi:hypothetical protein
MKKWILALLLVVCSTALSADLKYLVDMRTGLMDMLSLDAPTAFYTSARLNRVLNRGITFVQEATKIKQVSLAYQFDTTYRYSLPDSVTYNGVAFAYAYQVVNQIRQPAGLSYKDMTDFSKAKFTDPSIYTLWNNVVYISSVPKQSDSVYFLCYQTTSDLATDSAIVQIPKRSYRELALNYAYWLCLTADRNYAQANTQWQNFTTMFQMATGLQYKQPEPVRPNTP